MEEKWMIELDRRLQEDEAYQLWEKGAQNLRSYLESRLTGEDWELLIDYAAALSTMEVYKVHYAYELGVEHGRGESGNS